jgi:geranylgeranyl diphosphate synthase, type II
MLNFKECSEIIEQEIAQIPGYNEPFELYNPIRYTLSMGGKRIRPCLALIAHQLYSDIIDDVINPALGAEIFHNFTLLHDDIMDNAVLRRNFKTVHVKWNANVAILSGDAMMILAYHLVSKTSERYLPRILNLFNRTALEVCEGQQMDMNFESRNIVSEAEYMEMIRLKTAVLIATSLAIGGITGQATETDIEGLYQLGIHIGLAFQLQDDFLDVFADSRKFGKQLGNDILSNKKTYLLINALNAPEEKLVEELQDWIRREKFNPEEKIISVKKIYRQLGVDITTQKLAEDYFSKGLGFLDQLKVGEERKMELKNIISYLMKRER